MFQNIHISPSDINILTSVIYYHFNINDFTFIRVVYKNKNILLVHLINKLTCHI